MAEIVNEANDKMIEELSSEYADYIKVDLSSQTQKIHEKVDEMLIRLEEFESIVGMVHYEQMECGYNVSRIRFAYPELLELCQRIDKLEHVVARASIDLNNWEAAVDRAEAELAGPSTVSDRILGILNPFSLFKSKSSEASSSTSSLPKNERQAVELPPIFKTSDFFSSEFIDLKQRSMNNL